MCDNSKSKDRASTDNLKYSGRIGDSRVSSLPIKKSVVRGDTINDGSDESKYLQRDASNYIVNTYSCVHDRLLTYRSSVPTILVYVVGGIMSNSAGGSQIEE